uniref:ABC transporter ATP-binding protein n=1 Tax=Streptococcus salivarius TaxID=1304 RepID=UPI0015EF249A|nr:ABC transporter ATP-binding protein [Streptococcus salivarius]
MEKELISIDNISKKFDDKLAIKNFSLKIFKGDCIGLIGPNGAGKTTLLRMITGLLSPTTGNVIFDGEVIKNQKEFIGYLPQYPNYYEWMTPREFLKFSCKLFNMDTSIINERIEEVLSKVGLLEDCDRVISGFSGGMRQRLGIAQAIIHKPKFVVLDEPVSALDPIGRREILNLINDIKKETTIIFSTHILADAQEVCDRFCVVKKGAMLDDFYLLDMLTNNSYIKLNIRLIDNDFEWINYLKNMQSIDTVFLDQNNIIIKFNAEIDSWKSDFLKSLIDYDVNFSRIEVNNFSLEDYFMQLMEDKHEKFSFTDN